MTCALSYSYSPVSSYQEEHTSSLLSSYFCIELCKQKYHLVSAVVVEVFHRVYLSTVFRNLFATTYHLFIKTLVQTVVIFIASFIVLVSVLQSHCLPLKRENKPCNLAPSFRWLS